jgi:hypothetical protein
MSREALCRSDASQSGRASDTDLQLTRWFWLDLGDEGAAPRAALGAIRCTPHLKVTTSAHRI